MSAENPPHDPVNSETASEKKEIELTPEQVANAEAKRAAEQALSIESKAAEEASAVKLESVRGKLGLSSETIQSEPQSASESETVSESESSQRLESLPRNRSLVIAEESEPGVVFAEENPAPSRKEKKNAEPTEIEMERGPDGTWVVAGTSQEDSPKSDLLPLNKEYFPTIIPEAKKNEVLLVQEPDKESRNPEIAYPYEKIGDTNFEELVEHAESREKMLGGLEDHHEALSEKNALEHKESEEQTQKRKEVRQKLQSAAKNAVIGLGFGVAATGVGSWTVLTLGSYVFGTTPLFSAASALSGAGLLGTGVLGIGAAWFIAITFQEFFKAYKAAGGIGGIFKFGGGKGGGGSAPKKAAGGGAAHGGGGGGAHH